VYLHVRGRTSFVRDVIRYRPTTSLRLDRALIRDSYECRTISHLLSRLTYLLNGIVHVCVQQSSRSVALIIWLMSFLVGLYVATIAFTATLCIKHLTGLKLAAVYACILNEPHISVTCLVFVLDVKFL